MGVNEKLAVLKQCQKLDIQLAANTPRIRAVQEQLAAQQPEPQTRAASTDVEQLSPAQTATIASSSMSSLPSDIVARARHLVAQVGWRESHSIKRRCSPRIGTRSGRQ